MTIGASDGLGGNAQTCDPLDRYGATPAVPDYKPKLWAAVAAGEIAALGEPGASIVDAVLEHRLDRLGGSRALDRLSRAELVLTWLERRAWLLGEIETLGELAPEEHEARGASFELVERAADELRRRVRVAESALARIALLVREGGS